MLSDIEHKKSNNDLQAKIKNDLKIIANSDKVLTKSDKTSNIYKMEPDTYKKLLNSNIQSEYKKQLKRCVCLWVGVCVEILVT